jgi:hypothetical protein
MRAFLASILLIAAFLGFSSGVGADTLPDRPPGVAAADWVPVSSLLGLVLAHPRPSPSKNDCACYKTGLCGWCDPPGPVTDPTVLLVAPPVEGYFMIKRGSTWRRLVIVDPLLGPGPSG